MSGVAHRACDMSPMIRRANRLLACADDVSETLAFHDPLQPMTPEIALLLAQDGISTGAIYVLVALGIVLIFLVTRVIFVPFGDVVGYSALTLAALQLRQMPGTVWLVLTLAAIATAMEVYGLVRRGQTAPPAEGAAAVRRAARRSRRRWSGWPPGATSRCGSASR